MVSRAANFFYPYACHTERAKIFLEDSEFIKDYKRFDKLSTHSMDRKYSVIQFLKLTSHLSGETAECGVFKGATSYFILKYGSPTKEHHVFDSFEWLSAPLDNDWNYWEHGDLSCSLAEVKKNLEEFPNVVYHKGRIPDGFANVRDKKFSFVYIDVDLYQPTKDSLVFFYENLVEGGVIICDDSWFTSCPGARKAVDEIVAETWATVLELATWQSVVIKSIEKLI